MTIFTNEPISTKIKAKLRYAFRQRCGYRAVGFTYTRVTRMNMGDVVRITHTATGAWLDGQLKPGSRLTVIHWSGER